MVAPIPLAGPADVAPETPCRLHWLAPDVKVKDALRALGEAAGIELPSPNERESPSKRKRTPTHDIKYNFSDLFFLDRTALEREIQGFLESLPAISQYDEKLEYLSQRLSNARLSSIKQRTPQSNKQWLHSVNPSNEVAVTNNSRPLSAPPSPTLSIKHAPKLPAYPVLAPSMLPPVMSPSRTTSANTSFWSEATKPSQEPQSSATSVGSFMDGINDLTSTQKTDFPMSSGTEAAIVTTLEPDLAYLDVGQVKRKEVWTVEHQPKTDVVNQETEGALQIGKRLQQDARQQEDDRRCKKMPPSMSRFTASFLV